MAISLYRGNLHRVSDAPRQWSMPRKPSPSTSSGSSPRGATKTSLASPPPKKNPSSSGNKDEEVEAMVDEEEEGEVKIAEASDPQPSKVGEEAKGAEDSKAIDADAKEKEKSSDADAVKGSEIGRSEAKPEILNVEEEIKRRNVQSASLRSSIPLQAETAVDMGSATRHIPKLSVEVNFSGDLGAESDAAANHSAHRRQMHHVHGTSPSAASFTMPFQQNMFLATPRSSLAISGQGQTSSDVFVGNTAAATSSPLDIRAIILHACFQYLFLDPISWHPLHPQQHPAVLLQPLETRLTFLTRLTSSS